MDVLAGSTDVTTYFQLSLVADGTDATGLTITDIDLQYCRSGATPAAKVDATALGAANSAHGDNQAIEVDATDTPGLYRVDWPDAAFAAGVREVVLTVKCATVKTESLRVNLTPVPVDVRQWLGTAASTPTVAGVPNVNVKTWNDLTTVALPLVPTTAGRTLDVASTGEAGLDFGNVAIPDGPVPIAGITEGGTAQSATGTTLVMRSGAVLADNVAIGSTVWAFGSDQGYWQQREVTDNTLSTDTLVVDAWDVTPTGTITYRVFGSPPALTALPSVNVTQAAGVAWGSGAITSAAIADDAITAAKIAADAGTEIGTAVWATVTRVLTAATNISGPIADQVWEETLADHEGTVGSTAEALATAGGSGASAADIADAVWDEVCSGHTTNGTYGKAFSGATNVFLASGIAGTINTLDALDTAQDTQHSTTQGLVTTVDTVVDSILVDTAEIGAAGAGLTNINLPNQTMDIVGSITGNVSGSVGSVTAGVTLTTAYDLYSADIHLAVDEANTQDEWTITWFKNGVRVTSGITVPTIQVVKRADGTDLIASTTPTQIASTGSYKHDATTTARITAGEAVLVIVTATIDAGTRTFSRLAGRDST